MKTHIPLGDRLACGSSSPTAEYSTNDLCARCVAVIARRLAPPAPPVGGDPRARERARQFVLSICSHDRADTLIARLAAEFEAYAKEAR